MEFFETIKKRRSVRKFTSQAVPEAVIHKCIDAALLAPNSSNIQAWSFYWVRASEKKQKLVKACFSQNAAKTAAELIVAVSRIDTWKRNRDYVVENARKANQGKIPPIVANYYYKIIPLVYWQDPLGIIGFLKYIVFNTIALFKISPRGPAFRSDVFEMVTKSTALACENLMLALTAEGYASCPMEGFDEGRVKKILKLGRNQHIVMVIGLGAADPTGIYGEQYRVPKDSVVFEV